MRKSDRHQHCDPPPNPDLVPDSSVRRVHTALRHLQAHLHEPTVPPGDLVEPLLELWGAANECHPWVALPVQHFLTGLAVARPVPSSEVAALVEDVNVLLLEVQSLATLEGAPSAGPAG